MKEEIQQLVARGKTGDALEALSKYNSDALLLQARLSSLQREQRLGLLTHSNYSLEMNKINYSLLSMLNETNFAGGANPVLNAKKSVFFSYAHEDKELQQKLRVVLAPLRRSDKISDWSDEEIPAGSEWDQTIKERLRSANIILFLVSNDFINSDYIWEVEIDIAMRRHDGGEAIVVPVILRPCEWSDLPFGKLQALPAGGKPVESWDNQDEAFLSIARGLKKLL